MRKLWLQMIRSGSGRIDVQRSTFTGSTFTHETPTVDGKVFLTCFLMADEAEEVSIKINGRGEKSLQQVWVAACVPGRLKLHDVGVEDMKIGA